MFPPVDPDIFFQQWFKRYGSGTLLKCKGNGETAVCALPEFAQGIEIIGKDEMGLTKVKCLGTECVYQKDKSCHRLGTLQILLPELSGIGVWQISTGSWNSIVNLNSALDWLRGLCGRFAMLPVTLCRVPTDIAYEGKKSKHYILQIDLENVNIAQLQQVALIAPEKAAIGILPAPDEDRDELLYLSGGNGTEVVPEKEQQKDIPETPAMQARAAEIADAFKQCKTFVELEEAGKTYQTEITTKMSNALKQWLRDEYNSALDTVKKKAKK